MVSFFVVFTNYFPRGLLVVGIFFVFLKRLKLLGGPAQCAEEITRGDKCWCPRVSEVSMLTLTVGPIHPATTFPIFSSVN